MRLLFARRALLTLALALAACSSAVTVDVDAATGGPDAGAKSDSGRGTDAAPSPDAAARADANAPDATADDAAADDAAADDAAADDAAADDAAADDASEPDAFIPPDAGACGVAPRAVVGAGFTSVLAHASDPLMVFVADLAAAPDGTLWALDPANNGLGGDGIYRIDTDGSVHAVDQPANAALCGVSQLARDPGGDLLYYDTFTNRLLRTTPAGMTTQFAPLLNLSGGGSCIDSGVIAIAARTEGGFWLGSPVQGRVYTLSADGATRTEIAALPNPFRITEAPGPAAYVWTGAPMRGTPTGIWRVESGVAPLLVHEAGTATVSALGSDASGAIYFGSGTTVYRKATETSPPIPIAECFPHGVTDIEAVETAVAGAPNLYISMGTNLGIHEPGDVVWVITR